MTLTLTPQRHPRSNLTVPIKSPWVLCITAPGSNLVSVTVFEIFPSILHSCVNSQNTQTPNDHRQCSCCYQNELRKSKDRQVWQTCMQPFHILCKVSRLANDLFHITLSWLSRVSWWIIYKQIKSNKTVHFATRIICHLFLFMLLSCTSCVYQWSTLTDPHVNYLFNSSM